MLIKQLSSDAKNHEISLKLLMRDSKVVEILQTLTKDEFKKLQKFAASPVYSTGRDLVPFLNELKPFFPAFDHKNLTEEYIYKKLYGKKYGDSRSYSLMKTLSSELFKLCKEFFIYIELDKDENRKNFYILKQLRERKLYKEFEKEYAVIKNSLDKMKAHGPEDFLNLYYISHAYTAYCIETGRHSEAINSILDMRENSLIHAVINAYRNPELKITAAGYNVKFRYNFVDSLIENVDSESMLSRMKSNDDKFYPYAAVNYMAHMINIFPEKEEYYYRLKELVNKYIDYFNSSEKYILHGILASYCTHRSMTGDAGKFTREQFEINNNALGLGAYKWSPEDHFQVSNFRNMLLTAIDLDEIEWVEKFIEKYSGELLADYREGMKYYSLAQLHFKKKEFEAALENLIKVKYDFFLYKLDIRFMMFKIYYELNYVEEAISMLNALAQFIAGTKEFSENFKQKANSFVRLSRELIRRRVNADVKDIELFARTVKESQPQSQGWILKKVEEMVNN